MQLGLGLHIGGQYPGVSEVPVAESRILIAANSQYFSIPDNASLSTGVGTSWTVGGWVKFATVGTEQGIAWKGDNNLADAHEWWMRLATTNQIRGSWSTGAGAPEIGMGLANVVSESWYFIWMRQDTTTSQTSVYRTGGVIASSGSAFASWDSTKPFEIGRARLTTNFLNGEVKKWFFAKRAFSDVELAWLENGGVAREYSELGQPGNDGSNLLTELSAYWPLNEFAGGDAIDSHGSNDLTFNSAA